MGQLLQSFEKARERAWNVVQPGPGLLIWEKTWVEPPWSSVSKEKVKVKVAQSCLTLCDPMDYTVHEILQARIYWSG